MALQTGQSTSKLVLANLRGQDLFRPLEVIEHKTLADTTTWSFDRCGDILAIKKTRYDRQQYPSTRGAGILFDFYRTRDMCRFASSNVVSLDPGHFTDAAPFMETDRSIKLKVTGQSGSTVDWPIAPDTSGDPCP